MLKVTEIVRFRVCSGYPGGPFGLHSGSLLSTPAPAPIRQSWFWDTPGWCSRN